MNAKVYILSVSAFVVGMVELIVGGILPLIADDLNVSVSAAGQLITIFALVLAIAGPLTLAATANIERKRLYLLSLATFFAGNILSFLSVNFEMLVAARVITAISASLILVLSLTIAPKLVAAPYRARAIGIVVMGVSGSLVLGVPIGVLIGERFGWRILFLLIALLTLASMAILARFLDVMPPEKMIPLREQVASLRNGRILSAHIVTMLVLAGHYILYAYFTPFLQDVLNLNPFWISVSYFVFGLAAVAGGGAGGLLSDKLGDKKSILLIIGVFAVTLFAIPFVSEAIIFFPVMLIVWGMLSWALSPAQQSFLIKVAPESAGIQQSFNQSALQFGIAIGSAIGGLVIDFYPVTANAWAGAIVVVIAFGFALYALSKPKEQRKMNNSNVQQFG
ncbi:MAG: MFS transporter [Bacillus sp. (in: firmicutes)]